MGDPFPHRPGPAKGAARQSLRTVTENRQERRRNREVLSLEPLEFGLARTDAELEALSPEWLELVSAAGTQNPFAHPAWVRAWLRHFVPRESDRLVVAVRSGGKLVAVAPFHRTTYGHWPLTGRCLQLVGGGSVRGAEPITEMGEIVIPGEGWRRVMRLLLHFLATDLSHEFDWLGIALGPDQGWFDNRWLPDTWLQAGSVALHKQTRPFVVLPLPDRWDDLRLKRNMKEAIRRAKNRLAALDPAPELEFVTGDDVPLAVNQVSELHRRRATMRGHAPHHNYFSEPVRRFAVDAVDGLARTGHASVARLSVDGTPIAGRTLLTMNGGLFLSFSGLDPDYWSLGASTFVVVAAIRRAIERGDTLVNFSAYADQAKLRWSEQLMFHNQFVVVSPRRSSQRAFRVFWPLSASRHASRARMLARGTNAAV